MRIVVLGYIIRGPLGGLTWHHLQYVLGLRRLGHETYFMEDSDDYASCYDPSKHLTGVDPSFGLRYARQVFDRVGIDDSWSYFDAHQDRWYGPLADRAVSLCHEADMVINVSGVNPLRSWFREIPYRVLIDTDPVFTQVRMLQDPRARAQALLHNAFFTFGENIPDGCSSVPRDGNQWHATRQPVFLEAWPVTPGDPRAQFTSVMQWDSYDPVEYEGRRYGLKSDSFRPFFSIPRKLGPHFELALGSVTAPRELLRSSGWSVRDPLDVTRDPWSYQKYIQSSRGEFAIAKHAYVVSRSGWFSERSAAYLASARPILVQDTGFTTWLETDGGVVVFRTLEDACAGYRDIMQRYEFHCRSARELAESHFDSDKVLGKLVTTATNP